MNSIVIDLDNVISDTDAKIRAIIKRNYGISARRKDITEFDYEKCLPITYKQAKEMLEEFHNYHLLNLKLVRGARSALDVIASKFKVIIATERPLKTKQPTLEWLRQHGIPSQQVVFLENKREISLPRVNHLIDDKWDTAIEIANMGVSVILFDRPWNRKGNHELIKRAHGWKEVLMFLTLQNLQHKPSLWPT